MGQKAEMSVKLILGMRLPAVQSALEPYGFAPSVVEEGWRRMSGLTAPRLGHRPPPRGTHGALKTLTDFQSVWFRIARRTLANTFPQFVEPLLYGLRIVRGRAVLLTVEEFIQRLEQMERSGLPYGDEGPLALGALRSRGLTEQVLEPIRALLEELTSKLPEAQQEQKALERERQATEHLWTWYLEWSAIARTAIANKNLLSALGLWTPKERAEESGEFVVVPVLATS